MTTRIGMIRNAVENAGGNVAEYFANGPGSVGGFPRTSNKVKFKAVTCGMSFETMCDAISEIECDERVEEAYIAHKGDSNKIIVIFSQRASAEK